MDLDHILTGPWNIHTQERVLDFNPLLSFQTVLELKWEKWHTILTNAIAKWYSNAIEQKEHWMMFGIVISYHTPFFFLNSGHEHSIPFNFLITIIRIFTQSLVLRHKWNFTDHHWYLRRIKKLSKSKPQRSIIYRRKIRPWSSYSSDLKNQIQSAFSSSL